MPFASELGFLQDWGDREKARIRAVVSRAFRENRAAELFSDAYNSPNRSLCKKQGNLLKRVRFSLTRHLLLRWFKGNQEVNPPNVGPPTSHVRLNTAPLDFLKWVWWL